jgi:UMF1 family MFS transporter
MAASPKIAPAADRDHQKVITGWCFYDWANSAFATTIMAAVYPPFYRGLVVSAGLAPHQATALWGYTTSLALLIIAVAAPVLGAISDHTGGKKRFLAWFMGLGAVASGAMALLSGGAYLWGSLLFICGNIGFAGANIFYESLLPHVARPEDIDRVSTKGYALGYVGGGVLLVVNVCWILAPGWFGMPDTAFAVKASFVSVAVWWLLFSLPFFLRVPEPDVVRRPGFHANPVREGFTRLAVTFRDVRRYKQLVIFLVAFWVYNDGIGTIIKMATAYGDELGIEMRHMIIALIITQFTGIPFTFLFGRLAGRIGAKASVLLALGVYVLITIAGYFMRTALHFYLLAFMVGLVQGGSQGLSRSLFGAMAPKHKAAEFFGFFSTSAKFAGIAGPLVFGLVSQITGESRLSILSVMGFFLIGGLVLSFVDVDEGRRVAREAEAAAAAAEPQ